MSRHTLVVEGRVVHTLAGGGQGPSGPAGADGATGSISNLPAGNDTRILFADGTVVGYNAGFTFNKTTGLFTIPGQLKFPATQVPSADPNTLDDYEEGTFTPSFTFAGASVGLTYTSRTGTYTKIGNRVDFKIYMQLSAKGSSTGALTLTGLPFTSSSAATTTAVSTVYGSAMTGLGGSLVGLIIPSSTSIIVRQFGATGAGTTVTDANCGNTTDIAVTGTYFV